jgi:hypothetical protein
MAAAKASLISGTVFLIPGFLPSLCLARFSRYLDRWLLRPVRDSVSRGPISGLLLDLAAVAAVLLVCS